VKESRYRGQNKFTNMQSNRALMDELMGKHRDLLPNEKARKDVHFTDSEICKHFLCGFCPNDLFTNTKSDLGTCTKLHDEACKEEYQEAKKRKEFPFEREWIRHMDRLIDDLDRKIKRGHDRLEHQEEKGDIPLTGEASEKLNTISGKIQLLLKQMEEYGEEGKVEESQQLMKSIEQLKAEKEIIVLSADTRTLSSQEKRMKVCEICGAFLVVGDTEKRTASHLDGKQHQGYALIRKTLEDWKRNDEVKKALKDEEKRTEREKDKERRERGDRERERGDKDDKDRKKRSRERDRDRRDRDDRRRDHRGDDDRDKKRQREEH